MDNLYQYGKEHAAIIGKYLKERKKRHDPDHHMMFS